MARGGREGAAPKDEIGGPQFPTQRHRRASSQELRYLEPYFKTMTRKEWFGEAEVAAEGLLLRCGREVVSDTANRQEMEFPGVLSLIHI